LVITKTQGRQSGDETFTAEHCTRAEQSEMAKAKEG
jgi:hypothetical protein